MYTPLVVVELMGPVTLGLGEIAGDERTLEFVGNEETLDLKRVSAVSCVVISPSKEYGVTNTGEPSSLTSIPNNSLSLLNL